MVLRTSPLPLVPRDLVPAIGSGVQPPAASTPEGPTAEPGLEEPPMPDREAAQSNPADEAAVTR
jgi:hypothetical protein